MLIYPSIHRELIYRLTPALEWGPGASIWAGVTFGPSVCQDKLCVKASTDVGQVRRVSVWRPLGA